MTRNGIVMLLISIAISSGMMGCTSSDNHVTDSQGAAPRILSISPPDGATGVPVHATLHIKFDRPMDTLSVMQHMHLSGDSVMQAWMDSQAYMGGMGSRGMGSMGMMNREQMVEWMNQTHVTGTYHWNSAMDSCEFVPESALAGNMEYMIALDREVMSGSGYHMNVPGGPLQMKTSHFSCAP